MGEEPTYLCTFPECGIHKNVLNSQVYYCTSHHINPWLPILFHTHNAMRSRTQKKATTPPSKTYDVARNCRVCLCGTNSSKAAIYSCTYHHVLHGYYYSRGPAAAPFQFHSNIRCTKDALLQTAAVPFQFHSNIRCTKDALLQTT